MKYVWTIVCTCIWCVLTGCSSGHDAVEHGGNFTFSSPGGKTDISYDPPEKRQHLANISGPSLADKNRTISLTDYPHSIVVLNLWGQWCGPCRAEANTLNRSYLKYRAHGVQFVGINVRDQRDAAYDFVQDRHIAYPSIFDPAAHSVVALQGIPTSVTPVTIILDDHHRVAQVFLRSVTGEDLDTTLRKLVDQQHAHTPESSTR